MSEAAVHWWLALVQSTVTLLIVLDPFGLLPLVVGMTRQMSNKQRRRMLNKAVLVGFLLLLAFTFTGTGLLRLFRITLDDMRIAGGLLLLVLALNIVLAGHESSEETDVGMHMGVVPIASPLLVGPGSIATAVVLVGTRGFLIASLAVLCAFLLTWLVLRSTTLIYRVLGETGSDVIARIMGMLLAALAIVYIREGVIGIIEIARKTVVN